jgi:hypothetical protein
MPMTAATANIFVLSETSNATDWATNMIRCRVEGRFATSVFSPAAVVKGDLTA